jgi:hypothetical protein
MSTVSVFVHFSSSTHLMVSCFQLPYLQETLNSLSNPARVCQYNSVQWNTVKNTITWLFVLVTWDLRSGKGTLRALYWSHSACRREAAKIESESVHVFHTLVDLVLSSQRRSLCSLFSSLSGND